MKQAMAQIYAEGRSRTAHGTNDRLANDWTEMRALAEILTRYALIGCLHWAAENPEVDDPDQLRVKANSNAATAAADADKRALSRAGT